MKTLTESQKNNIDLKEENNILRNKLQFLSKENSYLKENLITSEKKFENLISDSKKEKIEKIEELNKITKDFSELQIHIFKLKNENKSLYSEIELLENEKSKWSIKNLDEENKILKKKLAEIENEKKDFQNLIIKNCCEVKILNFILT